MMAFFPNTGAGNPQAMYDNGAMSGFQQGMPPNQQRVQHPGGPFPPGMQQQFAQFPNQMPPGFQAQFQQQAQHGQRPQFARANSAQMQQHQQQQLQQMQMAQAAQQRGMNQNIGQGGDVSMLPPSSGPMNMSRNIGATLQQGNLQRAQAQAQAQAQAHARGGGHPQFAQQDSFNFNTSTPPSAGSNLPFFPQPAPSPTQTQNLSTVPGGMTPSMSPQAAHQQHGGQMRKPSMPASQRQVVQPPLSPAEKEREDRRVTALLTINAELYYAAIQLRTEGRGRHPTKQGGGQTSPTVSEHGAKEGDDAEKKSISSPEYLECMRRVQANLAYLAAVSDRMHKPAEKIPPHPAILETLPTIPGNTIPKAQLQILQTLYKELKELFPGAVSRIPAAPPSMASSGPVGAAAAAINGAQMSTNTAMHQQRSIPR